MTDSPPSQEPKRKRLGRSSRRRAAKIKALEEQISNLESGTIVEDEEPSNRVEQTWPGVLDCRKEHSFIMSKDDERALICQLSFLPGNALKVAARVDGCSKELLGDSSKKNDPLVLELYPLCLRGSHGGDKETGRKFRHKSRKRVAEGVEEAVLEPFPTLYWLTHPLLRVYISQLELQDYVKIMEKRLEDDTRAMESMKRAHELYARHRWLLLCEEDIQELEKRNWTSALQHKGVAGISNFRGIKCLHAHAAHYLSGGPGALDNIVGKWVWEELLKMVRQRRADTSKALPEQHKVDEAS